MRQLESLQVVPGSALRRASWGLRAALLFAALTAMVAWTEYRGVAGVEAADKATITADPNPVPAGTGFGSTTVTWDTGDGSQGKVYVTTRGGPTQLFGTGAKGSLPAPWIGDGTTYEFRLHAGDDRGKLLASVKVTRKSK